MNKLPQNGMPPIHPGEVLREEFLVPIALSANALAQAIHVPADYELRVAQHSRELRAELKTIHPAKPAKRARTRAA